ncbi:inositol monophosphatase family protein, partial [Methylorubrum podarium]|uniref:inositol monophosphatase family protein n=1 Tax=Methylorubrum podarium TaxID=200476 RepID=UPI0024C18BA2
FAGYEFEHAFNETWSFRQNLRYSFSDAFQNSYLNQTGYADAAQTQLARYQFLTSSKVGIFQVDNQAEARFFTTAPEGFTGADAARYQRLVARTALRRYGGDCYAYGLLASGHCDLIAETGLQPYDVMALVPVIRAAGGVITDWNGEDLTLDFDGRVLAAATPDLHAEALAILRG